MTVALFVTLTALGPRRHYPQVQDWKPGPCPSRKPVKTLANVNQGDIEVSPPAPSPEHANQHPNNGCLRDTTRTYR